MIAQTSGSLIPRKVFEKEGLFDETFFIDCVVWEYCLRLMSHGWVVRECRSAVLRHSHGSPEDYKLLGLKFFVIRNYGPVRRYYQARNALWLFRRYGRKQFLLCIYILGGLVKNVLKIFAETDRRGKLSSAFRGFVDGAFGKMDGGPRTRG